MASLPEYSLQDKKMILQKLNLLPLCDMYKREGFLESMRHINMDSEKPVFNQMISNIILRLNQETNRKLEDSSEVLENTVESFNSSAATFITSYNTYFDKMEEILADLNLDEIKECKGSEVHVASERETVIEDNMDLESEIKEVKSLYKNCYNLLEENITLRNKLENLKATLEKYQVLPCDDNKIEEKIAEAQTTLDHYLNKED